MRFPHSALVLSLAVLAVCPGAVLGAGASDVEWRLVFKLNNVTTRAGEGEVGSGSGGDDTLESNSQIFRAQLTGKPVSWLRYQVDYLNVKQDVACRARTDRPLIANLACPPASEVPAGAALFRRSPVRSRRRWPGCVCTKPHNPPPACPSHPRACFQ